MLADIELFVIIEWKNFVHRRAIELTSDFIPRRDFQVIVQALIGIVREKVFIRETMKSPWESSTTPKRFLANKGKREGENTLCMRRQISRIWKVPSCAERRMRRKVCVIFKCQSKPRPENRRAHWKQRATSTQIQKEFAGHNKWLRMNFNAHSDSAELDSNQLPIVRIAKIHLADISERANCFAE